MTEDIRTQAAIAAMRGILAGHILSNIDPQKIADDAIACANALCDRLNSMPLSAPTHERFAPPPSNDVDMGGTHTFTTVVKMTPKAYLFSINGIGYWVPKKQVAHLDMNKLTVTIKAGFMTNPVELKD